MSGQRPYVILEPLLLALMVIIGMFVGLKMSDKKLSFSLVENTSDSFESIEVGAIEEIVKFIDSKYVDEIDQEDILIEAIESIFSSLDPHSNYISPERLKEINEEMEGSYVGVGIRTIYYNDTIYVSEVLKDTPSNKAGLLRGDKLLFIGSDSLSGTGKEYQVLRRFFDREEGQEVSLKLLRGNEEMELVITPESIKVSSVDVAYKIAENTAYIKLKRFSENVYTDFMTSLETVADTKEKIDLILDLRENPGGYLPQTVKILNQIFKEKGRVVVYTVGRDKKKIEYKTNGKRFYNIDKVIVLINDRSASASEIIAGAIQDWDRGLVIGETSYGKGLVQEQYPLKNGGAIRLTVSRYFTPSGRLIQRPFKNEMIEEYQDSAKFLTRLLKRKISGSGGIIPDLIVPDGYENDYTETCLFALDQLDIYSLITQDQDLNKAQLISGLHQFLSDKQKIDKELLCDSLIKEEYTNRRLYVKKGNEEWFKEINSDDPVILAALEKLKNKDLFAGLTEREN